MSAKCQHHDLTSNTSYSQPIHIFWRMKAPSGRMLTCAAYKGLKADVVELRVGYDDGRPLVIEHASNLFLARQRAGQLLETLEKLDGFERLQ